MAPLGMMLVVAGCLCLGSAASTTAVKTADGAPVGVLYDTSSEQSRLLAELLARSDPNVVTKPAKNCIIQVTNFREAGIHRLVSLCEKTPEAGNDILMTLADDCPPNQYGCHSLQLPAASQWQALATLVRQLQLPRVLLADSIYNGTLISSLAEQGVQTVDVTPEALYTTITNGALDRQLSDPSGSVAVVQTRAALLPALRWLDRVAIRAEHWFVPGVAAEPLTAEERQLMGAANLYTMQTGVAPGAQLPEVPEGSNASSVALALDAVSAARGAATGLTGALEFNAQRRRAASFVEVLVHRPSEGAALVPRAGDWVPVAVLKGDQLLPPSVQYVLPSVLMPQLSGGADCKQGRLSLAGTDAVVGRKFRREFAVGDAPHMLLIYGSAPFLLSLECTNVTSDLHCGAEGPDTCVHLQHTFLPAADEQSHPALTRHRRSAPAHYVRGSANRRAPAYYRSGRANGASSDSQASQQSSTQVRSGQYLAGVNRAGGYEGDSSPATYTQQHGASQTYERQHAGTPYARQYTADSYQAPHTGLAVRSPSRRHGYKEEPVLTKHEVLRVALSDIFGCFGAMGGCGLCMQYFSVYSTIEPEGCYAACALGISGNCVGAIGNILSQVLQS